MIEIIYNSKFKQLILDSLKYFLDQFFPPFIVKKIVISINSNEGLRKRATLKTPPPNRWGTPPNRRGSGSLFKFQTGLIVLTWSDPGLEAPNLTVYS